MVDKKLLKNGDIFLFHTKGFSPFSMGIRQLTNSFWNHSGAYIENVSKEGFIIEALGRGVVKTSVEKYLDEKYHFIKIIRLKRESFKDIDEYTKGISVFTERMEKKIGSKYDWTAILWLGFKYIFKGIYKKTREFFPIGNPLQKRDKFFCSEVICESCLNISSLYPYLFQGNTKQVCDTTTPKDIGKTKNINCIYGKDIL